jgi:hypothetical protein
LAVIPAVLSFLGKTAVNNKHMPSMYFSDTSLW